jgi:parallel beta-helix repeat protein
MKRGILLVLIVLFIVNAQFGVSKIVDIGKVNELSKDTVGCDSCITCTAATTNAPAGTVVQLSQDLAADANCIVISSSDIILDCNGHRIYKTSFLENDTAIYIGNKDGNEIKNCYIEDFAKGIEISSGEDNVIENNIIDGAADYGIYLIIDSHSNTVYGNEFMGSIYNSIRVVNSDNNIIDNNTISDSQKAIYIKSASHDNVVTSNYISGSNFYGLSNEDGSDGTIIKNNTVSNTQQYGMILKDSSGVILAGNNIQYTGFEIGGGLKLISSNDNRLEQNDVQSPSGNGILLFESYDNFVGNNIVNSSGAHGIYLNMSGDNVVRSNKIFETRWTGLKIRDSHFNFVAGNHIYDNSNQGILVEDSQFNEIQYNLIEDNSINGIYVTAMSAESSLIGNVVRNNLNHGIRVKDSFINLIEKNIVSGNTYHGIYLDTATYNDLNANLLIGNYNYGIKILDSQVTDLFDNFASSNYFSGFLIYTSIFNNFVNNGAFGNSAGVSSTDQFKCTEVGTFTFDGNYCDPDDVDGCSQYGFDCESDAPEDYTCSDSVAGEIDKGTCFSEPSKIGSYCGAANVDGGDDVVANCNHCGCASGFTCDEGNGKCCDNPIICGEEFGSDCNYAGQEVCCGDDAGEYVRVGNGFTICCSSNRDTVSQDGKCVGRSRPHKLTEFISYYAPSGRFSPTGSTFLDNILALFKTSE